MPRQRRDRSFTAIDPDCQPVTLHVMVDVVDAGTRRDPTATVDGFKSIETNDGKTVQRIDKGVYQIVATEQRLTSDDPDAP